MIRVVSILVLYLGISSSIQQQGHSPLISLMSSHLQRCSVLDLYVHLSVKIHQCLSLTQSTKLCIATQTAESVARWQHPSFILRT